MIDVALTLALTATVTAAYFLLFGVNVTVTSPFLRAVALPVAESTVTSNY